MDFLLPQYNQLPVLDGLLVLRAESIMGLRSWAQRRRRLVLVAWWAQLQGRRRAKSFGAPFQNHIHKNDSQLWETESEGKNVRLILLFSTFACFLTVKWQLYLIICIEGGNGKQYDSYLHPIPPHPPPPPVTSPVTNNNRRIMDQLLCIYVIADLGRTAWNSVAVSAVFWSKQAANHQLTTCREQEI